MFEILKVMLADDENRIITYMKTSIQWEQLGLQVTACASDGEQAIEFAKKDKIDIVVTDIRMPKINGLELCKKLYEINPNVQIIIVSGYADFEYAQKAIELHVTGYCLKPINPIELTVLLRTAFKNVCKEDTINGDALLDAIEEDNKELIHKCFKEMGICTQKYYIAASVHLHNVSKVIGAELTIKLGKHKYLYFSSVPLNYQNACQFICYTKEKGGIGIIRKPVLSANLKKQISNVVIMAHQFFINNTPTLCENYIEEQYAQNTLKNLKTSLKDTQKAIALIEEIKNSNYQVIFNIKTAFKLYSQFYINKYANQNFEIGDFYLYGYEQFALEYNSFDDVLLQMQESLKLQTNIDEPIKYSTSTFMKILKYINEHYKENISLQILSKTFHMNASYISYLIKNETGVTYSQYLNELRIGKAKELLKTTNFTLAQISEEVGFNDYFYFIKKFKKEVGVTPGQYC